MIVELLYFDECPNWRALQQEANSVIVELGLREHVLLVRVENEETAESVRLLGSPTVRVNGKDIDPHTPNSGFLLGCGIYWVNGKAQGTPPREWLVRALTER